MKRIFLDTNFLLDLTARDEFKPDCISLLSSGKKSGGKFYISYLSIANFAYINRKKDKEVLYNEIKFLCNKFIILSADQNQIDKAIQLQAKDFEDALQYQTALSGSCDCIITRNTKDFSFSSIPVLTPLDFLKTLQ